MTKLPGCDDGVFHCKESQLVAGTKSNGAKFKGPWDHQRGHTMSYYYFRESGNLTITVDHFAKKNTETIREQNLTKVKCILS